jgi:hypothetical protein
LTSLRNSMPLFVRRPASVASSAPE